MIRAATLGADSNKGASPKCWPDIFKSREPAKRSKSVKSSKAVAPAALSVAGTPFASAAAALQKYSGKTHLFNAIPRCVNCSTAHLQIDGLNISFNRSYYIDDV